MHGIVVVAPPWACPGHTTHHAMASPTHPLHCDAAMGLSQSSQVPMSKGNHVKEVKVVSWREDTNTMPFFYNPSKGDTSWMVPSKIFYSKCIGEAIMEFEKFEEQLMEYGGVRLATKEELTWLVRHIYCSRTNTHFYLFPTKNLVLMGREYGDEFVGNLINSISTKLPPLPQDDAPTFDDPYPKSIPFCNIPKEKLQGPFSITSTCPRWEGTTFGKQEVALRAFKHDPPFSTYGNVRKVQETTIDIMVKQLGLFVGFGHQFLGKEPTMDLIMEPTSFAQYISFLLVSGPWGPWGLPCISSNSLAPHLLLACRRRVTTTVQSAWQLTKQRWPSLLWWTHATPHLPRDGVMSTSPRHKPGTQALPHGPGGTLRGSLPPEGPPLSHLWRSGMFVTRAWPRCSSHTR